VGFAILFSVLFLLIAFRLIYYYNIISLEYSQLGYAITLESFNKMLAYSGPSNVCYVADLDGLFCNNGIIQYGNSYTLIK
jgi:hypothetical protein